MTTSATRLRIDDAGRVVSAGVYLGRVVRLRNRRWVYGRPGRAPSTHQHLTAEIAAQALLDEVIAEGVGQ